LAAIDYVLSISEVNFIVGVVRVRCRRKKFTFAISSADEFFLLYHTKDHVA